MEILIVIVGLIVSIGTPLGTYVATRKGHAASERTAQVAADTALRAADLSAQTAARVADLNRQTTREERLESRFRWACEKAWSSEPAARAGGIAVLRSMYDAGELDKSDLPDVAAVLQAFVLPAISQLRDAAPPGVAAAGERGDAGEPPAERAADG